jgi:replicative DNA helicase
MITLMAVKHQCRAVFVDHIHLADAETKDNRERQIALISKGLKQLAKRLDIAVVGLCQLNRGAGGADEYQRRPQLRDLRDSGSLEADGDLIIMLHREDYYRASEPGYQLTGLLEALVRKNKDGPRGEVPLTFDGDHQRITDWHGGEVIQLPFGE